MTERNKTVCVALSDREDEALAALAKEQSMSHWAVMRQALRLYQLDHERRKAGETCRWSGDEQRAREFRGDPTPPLCSEWENACEQDEGA